MALITLISENCAKKDYEFTYIGPLNNCRNCKLKNVCFNLKQYNRYKVLKVRGKKHFCNIHEGPAVVVEVEQLPIITSIDKKYTKGSTTILDSNKCDQYKCDHFEICSNKAIKKDTKYKIINILEHVECLQNNDLQKVELEE
jgi:uncharacterized protein (UPF0179 family)